MKMTIHEKVNILLDYLQVNSQGSYAKVKVDLTTLNAELHGNSTVSEAQIQRYKNNLQILVVNYFTTLSISPLMFAVNAESIDLMQDILTCTHLQIDEVFNQKETVRESGWFGYENKTINGPLNGYTALAFAVRAGNYDAVKLLLDHYADPQHAVNDDNSVVDLLDAQEHPGVMTLLSGAKFRHIHQLCLDLIECKNRNQLEHLINLQQKLKITKADVVASIVNMYPEDNIKTMHVLEQASDVDYLNAAQNPLAEYMQRSQNLTMGTDLETLAKLDRAIMELTQPVTKIVGKPYLTVYDGKKEITVCGDMMSFGPQNLVHPLTKEEKISFEL